MRTVTIDELQGVSGGVIQGPIANFFWAYVATKSLNWVVGHAGDIAEAAGQSMDTPEWQSAMNYYVSHPKQ